MSYKPLDDHYIRVNIQIDRCSHCPNFNFTGNGDDVFNKYCDHPNAPLSILLGEDYIPIQCPRNSIFLPVDMKEPIVVVVNGYPTSGKDTFCEFARIMYKTINYSTVDTVKKLAVMMGWDEEKTPRNRDMLSALKDFYVMWFDGTFTEITELIHQTYKKGEDDFVFLHTREPVEIKRVIDWCTGSNVNCYSVFIDRQVEKTHGNHADSNVTDYDYDIYVKNDGTLEEFEQKSLDIFKKMVDNKV